MDRSTDRPADLRGNTKDLQSPSSSRENVFRFGNACFFFYFFFRFRAELSRMNHKHLATTESNPYSSSALDTMTKSFFPSWFPSLGELSERLNWAGFGYIVPCGQKAAYTVDMMVEVMFPELILRGKIEK